MMSLGAAAARVRNLEFLDGFAQKMADDIIQSYLGPVGMTEAEPEEPGAGPDEAGVGPREGREELAAGLASAVVALALREVCVAGDTDDHGECFQTSTCAPPLSQSGLPAAGSLDYPDAPPTTPLLPEPESSRRGSFARKLKGGLANEFLPSPPPPTPGDKDGEDDPRVDLLQHLMESLSVNSAPREVEAFAESLSCDIISQVMRAADGGGDLRDLARRLADAIIRCSIQDVVRESVMAAGGGGRHLH